MRGKLSRDKQWSDSAKNCRNKMAKKPWGHGKTCVDRWEEVLGHWNDNTTSIPWRVAIATKFQIPLFTRKMAMEWDEIFDRAKRGIVDNHSLLDNATRLKIFGEE